MRLRYLFVLTAILAATAMVGIAAAGLEQPDPPKPSYDRGVTMTALPESVGPYPGFSRKGPDFPPRPELGPALLKPAIECYDFDDNGVPTGGFRFIPPDPHVAVGPNHVINIGNVMIEWRIKDDPDPREHLEGLNSFFGTIPGPGFPVLPTEQLGTFKFDPKVIYDQYSGRFVVIALEQWDVICGGDPSDESRILVAVSKTSDPNLGWWFHVIDSKAFEPGGPVWADYPGIAVDDKALYITNNMFPFCSSGAGFSNRVWIVHKAATYAGPDQSIIVTVHDPVALSGAFYLTHQPAHMYGPLPVGSTGFVLGTYLMGYSGLTFGGVGGLEALDLIEITDPLGAGPGPLFTAQTPLCGDIEDVGGVFGFPALLDAPQAGSPALIEVNDRRALNAVWRDDDLYTCATITPNVANDPANAGHTTAHWWRLDTTVKAAVVVADRGNVGSEDLSGAPGVKTYTFFPSVMIDCNKNMAIGFSASNSGIFCGAYYASRFAIAPAGTIGPTCVLALGVDFYKRTFGGSRNRWGDYSGLALCPVDESTFWVYNEYAGPRGTIIIGEDGRWHTKIGCFRLKATVAVAVTSFEAIARDRGVDIYAEFISDISVLGVNVYRGVGDNEPTQLIRGYGPMEEGVAFRHTDTDVEPGREYSYKIGVVDAQGEFFSQTSRATVPVSQLLLAQNAPNPFNPVTTIRFTMSATEQVKLVVYDLNGRLVKTLIDEIRAFGPNEVEWDGTNSNGQSVSSGVYFYRLTAGKFVQSRKMTLLK